MKNRDNNYIPDILETIANLSNDEVFTPPKLANKILDLLPKEIWSDSSIKFLDPACKTGIFLREIASRLIEGLADEFPNLQERVNHILTKQVYGIGITELTTLMARRTLYCSAQANSEFSICTEFTNEIGNIVYPDTKHTWNAKSGRCEFCGANKDEYDRGENRENHAYSFIHDFNVKEIFGDMKFDVIIGNPPYQLSSGNSSSSIPIYNKFVDVAKRLNPKYINMIIPARWMMAGQGLDSFRKDMISDNKIKNIVDYQDSTEVFPSVSLNGGVCYFLWDRDYSGEVEYIYNDSKKHSHYSKRFLSTDFSEIVIRDSRQISIIEKVSSEGRKFSEIVSGRMPFGFETDLFNNKARYPEVDFSSDAQEGYSLMYGIKDNKRFSEYVNIKSIKRGLESINKYKLFFPLAFGTDTTLLPKIIKGGIGSSCTATFLKIGDFVSKEEADNCLSFMKTKFFRALFQFNKYSFVSSRKTFSLIPLLDLNKIWTDEELYKKYGLTEEEIAYIEDNIAPMNKESYSEEIEETLYEYDLTDD